MAAIDLDLRGWPVVVTRPHAGTLLDSELENYLIRFRAEIRARPGQYVSVVDLLESPMLTPTQRKILASGMGSDEASQQRCLGAALIFDSVLLRGVLTAIFWLRKPEHEVRVFGTLGDASEWAKDLVSRHSGRGVR